MRPVNGPLARVRRLPLKQNPTLSSTLKSECASLAYMAIYKAQAVFPMFTGLDKDVVVNNFHFEGIPADTDAAALTIGTRLRGFYDDVYGTAASGKASYVDWTESYVKVFNLSDPTPRVPSEFSPLIVGGGTNNSPIPTEVACVASWRAAPAGGVPYQRLYNRCYLGMITSAHMVVGTNANFPKFTEAFQLGVVDAMEALFDLNDGTLAWVQYSKAGGVEVTRDIQGGFCDNSPDSQRRRSVDSTSRQTWTG